MARGDNGGGNFAGTGGYGGNFGGAGGAKGGYGGGYGGSAGYGTGSANRKVNNPGGGFSPSNNGAGGSKSANGGRTASADLNRDPRVKPAAVAAKPPAAKPPAAQPPTEYAGPLPGDQPPSWTDDRYPGATSPQPERGFGVRDPYQSARGSFDASLPGGSTWQGNQVNNPVSAGTKGDYQGGGIAVGGRRNRGGFAGGFAQGGEIPPGEFGMVGEYEPEFVQGPARVTPMGSEQGIQMLIQALMGRQ